MGTSLLRPKVTDTTPDNDDSLSTDSDKMDEIIKRNGFFHGYLAREDAEEILKRHGDFLVRETIIDHQPEIVLSVRWDIEDKANWKHYRIQVDYLGHFTVNNSNFFETVEDLINNHWKIRQEPLVSFDDARLMSAVEREPWEFLTEEIMVDSTELGRGVDGKVFAGILTRKDGRKEKVAVKLCQKYDFRMRQDFFREARNLRAAHHPNVCQFIGISTFDCPLKLIMKMYEMGSLLHFLLKQGQMTSGKQKMRFVLDIAKGLAHIASLGILHMDLCARNCLLLKEDNGELKAVISDFGLSQRKETHQLTSGTLIPVRWAAPELQEDADMEATQKSDIWSLGILIWEIFANGEAPYSDLDNDVRIKSFLMSGRRMTPRHETPESLKQLMEKCWEMKPEKRPTAAECLSFLQKS